MLELFQGLRLGQVGMYDAELEQEEFSIELRRPENKKAHGKKYKANIKDVLDVKNYLKEEK